METVGDSTLAAAFLRADFLKNQIFKRYRNTDYFDRHIFR